MNPSNAPVFDGTNSELQGDQVPSIKIEIETAEAHSVALKQGPRDVQGTRLPVRSALNHPLSSTTSSETTSVPAELQVLYDIAKDMRHASDNRQGTEEMLKEGFLEFARQVAQCQSLNAGTSNMVSMMRQPQEPEEPERRDDRGSWGGYSYRPPRDFSISEIEQHETNLRMGRMAPWFQEFLSYIVLKDPMTQKLFDKASHAVVDLDDDERLCDQWLARQVKNVLRPRDDTRVVLFRSQVNEERQRGTQVDSGLFLLAAIDQFCTPHRKSDVLEQEERLKKGVYFKLGQHPDETAVKLVELSTDYHCKPRAPDPTGAEYYEVVLSKLPDGSSSLNTWVSDMRDHLASVNWGHIQIKHWEIFTAELAFQLSKMVSRDTFQPSAVAFVAEAGDGDDEDTSKQLEVSWTSTGAPSMPGTRTRPGGGKGNGRPIPKGRTDAAQDANIVCYDCGKFMPKDHPRGRKNCPTKCKSCGFGACPGNSGRGCIVQSTKPFSHPNVLNANKGVLPFRLVKVLQFGQEKWLKENGHSQLSASYAACYAEQGEPEGPCEPCAFYCDVRSEEEYGEDVMGNEF